MDRNELTTKYPWMANLSDFDIIQIAFASSMMGVDKEAAKSHTSETDT